MTVVGDVRWRQYEQQAAEFFRTLNMDAVVQDRVDGARGNHVVDVAIRFSRFGIDHLWIVECKHWKSRVGKAEVLALQQIVSDVGADRAFLLSETGFQSGAVAAARWSSVELTNIEDLASAAAEDAKLDRLARASKEHSLAMRALYDLSHLTGFERRFPAAGLGADAVLEVHADGFSLGLAIQRALAGSSVNDLRERKPVSEVDEVLELIELRAAEFRLSVRHLDQLADRARSGARAAVTDLQVALQAFWDARDALLANPDDPPCGDGTDVVTAMRAISDAANTLRAGGTKETAASAQRLMRHLVESSYLLAAERGARPEQILGDRVTAERLFAELQVLASS